MICHNYEYTILLLIAQICAVKQEYQVLVQHLYLLATLQPL